jgi:SAM-dependent methyltransferase
MDKSWHSDLPVEALEAFLQLLARRPEAPLLDLSAGYDLISLAAGSGLSVASIDCAREVLGAAREEDAIRLRLDDDSFGGVLCVGTFSRLPRSRAPELAAEIQRVLVPGGLAFASFAPAWERLSIGSREPRSEVVRSGLLYRRRATGPAPLVVYQTREIEEMFRRMKIVSLVTQINGARRLIARKRAPA